MALLAVIIIMFFLHDWRATFISALALPASVIATFAFIGVMGFTFNVITMLALSLWTLLYFFFTNSSPRDPS